MEIQLLKRGRDKSTVKMTVDDGTTFTFDVLIDRFFLRLPKAILWITSNALPTDTHIPWESEIEKEIRNALDFHEPRL